MARPSRACARSRRNTASFNPVWYLDYNADVLAAVGRNNWAGALDHYVRNGADEGRRSVR